MRSVRIPRSFGDGLDDARRLLRYRAGVRAEVQARLRCRKGQDRAISPDCMTLALDRLAPLSFGGKRELFRVLQRVLHTTRKGADLPLWDFSSSATGTKILQGLSQTKLIFCVNPDSWKPLGRDFKNAKARRYLPSSDLLLANAGLVVVDSAANYLEKRYASRNLTRRSTVTLDPAAGVDISAHVIAKLEAGTGFDFDLAKALPSLDLLPEEKRSRLLKSGQDALGCLGNPGPLHAHWSQTPKDPKKRPKGRLYASEPALLSLPKPLRPGLKGCDGGHAALVDFDNFEVRIVFSDAGIEAPRGDFYRYVGDRVALTRDAVKDAVNPWLHGQTEGNLFGPKKCNELEDRKKVEAFIKTDWPLLWEKIQSLKKTPEFLQRRGAEVFFTAYDEALRLENLPSGIPMHDGWIFTAENEPQAIRVKGIFEEVGSDLLGQPITVKHELLN